MDGDCGPVEDPLKLSWSPLGAPEASRVSKYDAQSLFDANLSVKSSSGASKSNGFVCFNGLRNIYLFDLKFVL